MLTKKKIHTGKVPAVLAIVVMVCLLAVTVAQAATGSDKPASQEQPDYLSNIYNGANEVCVHGVEYLVLVGRNEYAIAAELTPKGTPRLCGKNNHNKN